MITCYTLDCMDSQVALAYACYVPTAVLLKRSWVKLHSMLLARTRVMVQHEKAHHSLRHADETTACCDLSVSCTGQKL